MFDFTASGIVSTASDILDAVPGVIQIVIAFSIASAFIYGGIKLISRR